MTGLDLYRKLGEMTTEQLEKPVIFEELDGKGLSDDVFFCEPDDHGYIYITRNCGIIEDEG